MLKTATLLQTLPSWKGDAKLYHLTSAITYDDQKTTDHVVVSAVDVMFSGPETYIFPSDADGKFLDWGELDGSFRGDHDHDAALRGAGYEPCP